MHLLHDDQVLLTVLPGKGLKGPYFGLWLERGVLLPGKRFLVVEVVTDEHDGSLLFDLSNGQYMRLPKDIRVYERVSTLEHPNYRMTASGVEF